MAQLMNTIQGTYDRTVSEGIGISKHAIRMLVLSNQLPSVKLGKGTHLINYNVLLNFLNTGSNDIKPITNDNQIRKIEV